MAKNKLELYGDTTRSIVARKFRGQGSERRVFFRLRSANGTAGSEIGKQRIEGRPGDLQAVYIQYGISQACPHQRIADVMHVGKLTDFHRHIEALHCFTELPHAVRTETCKREDSILVQYAIHLGKTAVDVSDPGQHQVRECQGNALGKSL